MTAKKLAELIQSLPDDWFLFPADIDSLVVLKPDKTYAGYIDMRTGVMVLV